MPPVVTAVSIQPGGSLVAVAGDDHIVRIMNWETGELVRQLQEHGDWIRAAVFSPEGRAQTAKQVAYYMENAARLAKGLTALDFTVFGGVNAPYIWIRTPDGLSSWGFFDHLLENANIVCTPGAGFGSAGEGYARLSAFNSHENVDEAIRRIEKTFGN